MKLRLLVTSKCNRNCSKCCNKGYDLNSLPEFRLEEEPEYSEILITGGEPLLFPVEVAKICKYLRFNFPNTEIYIYIAWTEWWDKEHLDLFNYIDGVTVALHTQDDACAFEYTSRLWWANVSQFRSLSLRLNVFEGITILRSQSLNKRWWKIKDGLKWQKNCPLPEDEVFKQFKYIEK